MLTILMNAVAKICKHNSRIILAFLTLMASVIVLFAATAQANSSSQQEVLSSRLLSQAGNSCKGINDRCGSDAECCSGLCQRQLCMTQGMFLSVNGRTGNFEHTIYETSNHSMKIEWNAPGADRCTVSISDSRNGITPYSYTNAQRVRTPQNTAMDPFNGSYTTVLPLPPTNHDPYKVRVAYDCEYAGLSRSQTKSIVITMNAARPSPTPTVDSCVAINKARIESPDNLAVEGQVLTERRTYKVPKRGGAPVYYIEPGERIISWNKNASVPAHSRDSFSVEIDDINDNVYPCMNDGAPGECIIPYTQESYAYNFEPGKEYSVSVNHYHAGCEKKGFTSRIVLSTLPEDNPNPVAPTPSPAVCNGVTRYHSSIPQPEGLVVDQSTTTGTARIFDTILGSSRAEWQESPSVSIDPGRHTISWGRNEDALQTDANFNQFMVAVNNLADQSHTCSSTVTGEEICASQSNSTLEYEFKPGRQYRVTTRHADRCGNTGVEASLAVMVNNPIDFIAKDVVRTEDGIEVVFCKEGEGTMQYQDGAQMQNAFVRYRVSSDQYASALQERFSEDDFGDDGCVRKEITCQQITALSEGNVDCNAGQEVTLNINRGGQYAETNIQNNTLVKDLPPVLPYQPECARKSQGDANCDNAVNSADYDIWLEELQDTRSEYDADFDSSGDVDIVDYSIWYRNRE